MEGLAIATDKREITGKKVATLRRSGITPIPVSYTHLTLPTKA